MRRSHTVTCDQRISYPPPPRQDTRGRGNNKNAVQIKININMTVEQLIDEARRTLRETENAEIN